MKGPITQDKPLRLPESVIMSYGMSDYGYCIDCREEHTGVEPDACEYPCQSCEANKVYGAAELLFMGLVEPLMEGDEDDE